MALNNVGAPLAAPGDGAGLAPALNANRHMNRRRSIRLKDYDYSTAGAYFVTVYSHRQRLLFGHVVDERMIPSDSGNVVSEAWNEVGRRFPSVELDAFVVMPNHVHGIVFLLGAR